MANIFTDPRDEEGMPAMPAGVSRPFALKTADEIEAERKNTPAPIATPEELVELGAAAMYGKNWDGPLDKMPGPQMKDVWRDYARRAIAAALASSNAEIERQQRRADQQAEWAIRECERANAAEARAASLERELGRHHDERSVVTGILDSHFAHLAIEWEEGELPSALLCILDDLKAAEARVATLEDENERVTRENEDFRHDLSALDEGEAGLLSALRRATAELGLLTIERDEYRIGFEFKAGEADELRRQRDQLADTGPEWKQRAIDERLKVAALTDQVGRMREALAAVLNFKHASLPGITHEVFDNARAALSPTEPDAMEK